MSSISVDDLRAELGDLWALLRLSQAGTAQNSKPLSRYRYVDGGTSTPAAQQNGASGTPFSTIGAFMTAIGVGVSAADSQATFLGKPTPCLNGYTENVTFPSRRNTELRADSTGLPQGALVVTGNLVWANTAAAGGVAPTTAAGVMIHNILFSGTGTFTDDGTVASIVVISSDEFTNGPGITGAVIATGTDIASFNLIGASCAAAVTSTANATGFVLQNIGGNVSGNVVAKSVAGANGASFGGNITVASNANGGTPTFASTTFNGACVLTGGAGTIAKFDSPSWVSFLRNGGTLSSCIALVQGGYSGGPVVGAALSAANGINGNVSVGLNGTGASAAFTSGGNWYTVPAATLTGNRTVTLLTGAGELKGDTILITRVDATANTLTVANGGGGGGNVAILPISVKGSVLAEFDGTNWVLAETSAAT